MLNNNNPSSNNAVQTAEDQRRMNVAKSINEYILDMVDSVSGVKVLILDEFTVSVLVV